MPHTFSLCRLWVVSSTECPKKRLLLCTDVLSTLCMSMLALYSMCVIVWSAPILPLFFFLFLVVSVDTVNHPAFHSFVPHIISSENLPRINSGMGVMSNTLTIGGQLAGGVLILQIGAISVFWMNALSFVLSFFFIALLPKDTMPQYVEKNHRYFTILRTACILHLRIQ